MDDEILDDQRAWRRRDVEHDERHDFASRPDVEDATLIGASSVTFAAVLLSYSRAEPIRIKPRVVVLL